MRDQPLGGRTPLGQRRRARGGGMTPQHPRPGHDHASPAPDQRIDHPSAGKNTASRIGTSLKKCSDHAGLIGNYRCGLKVGTQLNLFGPDDGDDAGLFFQIRKSHRESQVSTFFALKQMTALISTIRVLNACGYERLPKCVERFGKRMRVLPKQKRRFRMSGKTDVSEIRLRHLSQPLPSGCGSFVEQSTSPFTHDPRPEGRRL